MVLSRGARHCRYTFTPKERLGEFENVITGELKSTVDCIWNTMWFGGIPNPLPVIEPKAPFSTLHSEGPEALFAGKENVVDGLFRIFEQLAPQIPEATQSHAG